MDEQKVLVTGGFEYIGSNTFQALQRPGFIPVIFDNLASGWRDAIEFGSFKQGDQVNKAACRSKRLSEHGLELLCRLKTEV